MAKAGRKSQVGEWLTDDGLILLEGWARDGLTDKEIAEKMGISQSTFYDWRNKFPQFSDALKSGRKPITSIVENTFFETKLQPQTVKETTKEKTIHRDANGNVTGSTEHIKETERYIPADTTAMIFYMKCRMPEKYNDRISVTVDTNNGKLADLIDGLKEPCEDDIYTETESINEPMADEPPETN